MEADLAKERAEKRLLKSELEGVKADLAQRNTELEGYVALGTVKDLETIKSTADTASARVKTLETDLLTSQLQAAYPTAKMKVLKSVLGDMTPALSEAGVWQVGEGDGARELSAWLNENHADYVPAIFPTATQPPSSAPTPAPKPVATLPSGSSGKAAVTEEEITAAQKNLVSYGF